MATVSLNGTPASQAVTDQETIAPCATVIIADPDPTQTETATVTLPNNGTLSNLGSGSYDFVTGSAAAVTAAPEGLTGTAGGTR